MSSVTPFLTPFLTQKILRRRPEGRFLKGRNAEHENEVKERQKPALPLTIRTAPRKQRLLTRRMVGRNVFVTGSSQK